jgi:hypothetical protein
MTTIADAYRELFRKPVISPRDTGFDSEREFVSASFGLLSAALLKIEDPAERLMHVVTMLQTLEENGILPTAELRTLN